MDFFMLNMKLPVLRHTEKAILYVHHSNTSKSLLFFVLRESRSFFPKFLILYATQNKVEIKPMLYFWELFDLRKLNFNATYKPVDF